MFVSVLSDAGISWSCPVKRLRSSGAERARAAISGGAKRSRAPMSSAPAEPRWQVQCLRAARSCNFEHLGGAERVRAAILSAPVEPSGLERPFRAPQWSRAGPSGHFERPSGADRARCHKRRQVQCFRGQAEPAERVNAQRSSGAPKASYGNFELDIYTRFAYVT